KPTYINNVLTYPEEGFWVSEIIDIGDNFNKYEKIISTIIHEENSKAEVYTRTSVNGINFGEWMLIDSENNITSIKNKFVQVRIDLFSDSTKSAIRFDL